MRRKKQTQDLLAKAPNRPSAFPPKENDTRKTRFQPQLRSTYEPLRSQPEPRSSLVKHKHLWTEPMRRWVFKVHLWIGALAGGFFVVLGITGSILAFELPLDHLLNAKLSYISPSPRDLPLNQILRSVQASFPSDGIAAVSFAGAPNLAWQVALPSGIAYVNPHTGQVLGLRSRGQTFLGFARRLHVSLASGNIGRSAIRWSNLATLLLLISGLGLWWQDNRIRLHGFDGTRRFWSDLHKAIGVVFSALLLIAS